MRRIVGHVSDFRANATKERRNACNAKHQILFRGLVLRLAVNGTGHAPVVVLSLWTVRRCYSRI